ncbi:hypothetical protein SO802_003890 [Lithocarpus litseifolius]|uniref:Uncharacterized protein n=1 Tax=Lithocarpus litseifolius TaxID=425828 RepID=A0AAW2E723_9ROSI
MPPTPPPPPPLSPPGCAVCKRCKPNCPFRMVRPKETPPPPPLSPPGCAACKRCKPNCPFRMVLPKEKSWDYQYLTLFFPKKNLEGMFRNVECDKRKNVLNSLMYECKCRIADPQFGCFGKLLELKQRCDYLERVVSNLLAHNQEVLMSTLTCPESHPIDFYQSNHQVPHIPNIEGFGLTPKVPPLLREYLQAQNNHHNNNSGFDGGNNNNNNSGFNGSIPIGFDGGGLRTADVASGSGLNDYPGSGVGFNHSGGDMEGGRGANEAGLEEVWDAPDQKTLLKPCSGCSVQKQGCQCCLCDGEPSFELAKSL